MRRILLQHKKGVSEIISYTLLIIIAITASILVYNFLKLSTPKDRPVCAEDVSLVVESVNCVHNAEVNNLTLVFQNKGKFTIDSAFIRLGIPGRTTKELITQEDESDLYFPGGGLLPNSESIRSFSINKVSINEPGDYVLEIQPAIFDDKLGKLAVCTNAIITQNIECK